MAAAKILKKLKNDYNLDFVKTLGLKIKKTNGEFKTNAELDLLTDLLDVDVGAIYVQLSGNAVLGEAVPFSITVVGANMAESFCEREIHVVNQIMTPERTSLDDVTLEKLAVLRMNRQFMESMKESYPTLAMLLNKYYSKDVQKLINEMASKK